MVTTWETEGEENRVRERSSSVADRYTTLPEEFTLEQLMPFYSNKRSAQTAIYTMVKKGIIEKITKNRWKKIVSNIYDTPMYK